MLFLDTDFIKLKRKLLTHFAEQHTQIHRKMSQRTDSIILLGKKKKNEAKTNMNGIENDTDGKVNNL